MEFMCNLLNIKLTEILKLNFFANYEQFIHIFPYFREIRLSHIPQYSRTYTHTDNLFTVPFPVFLLPYSAPVGSSRKFSHKQLQLYRYSNTTCCTVPCMAFIDVLEYVTFFTPLHSVHSLAVSQPLFTRSQSTRTGIITNGTMAHSHSTALLGSAVPLCTVTLRFN